jgi:pilus assembly protein Flp/PilA
MRLTDWGIPMVCPKRTMEISVNLKSAVFLELLKDESGQDLIEYALVAGLIGLGAVVAMTGLSSSIKKSFNSVGSSLTNAL